MRQEQIVKADIPPSSLWAGGLLTVSLVILQSFLPLDKNNLDTPIYISMGSFALATPILVYKLLIDLLRRQKLSVISQSIYQATASLKTPPIEVAVFLLGIIAAIVGVATAFWHIHWSLGIIFLISTAAAAGVYFSAYKST